MAEIHSAPIKITPEELAKSAHKFRSELLMMPVHSMSETLAHMKPRYGIRYAETVGELSGDIEMGPYSETREDNENVNIKGRTLYTYLGSVIKNFSPNSVVGSIYDAAQTKGEALKRAEIVKRVVSYLSAKIGDHLNAAIWNGVRNANGTTSKDLFDGFDTIATKEITDGNIAVAKNNLYEFTEAINANNALEQLKNFCRAALPKLRERKNLKLYVSQDIYDAYVDDYQATVGAIVYNKTFDKLHVEGFPNVELVVLANKTGSPFIQLTTANNMLVGFNQRGEEEHLAVEKYKSFVLTFEATMFMGCQYESISPEALLVGKLFTE